MADASMPVLLKDEGAHHKKKKKKHKSTENEERNVEESEDVEQLAEDLENRKRKAEEEELQDCTPNKKKKKKKKKKKHKNTEIKGNEGRTVQEDEDIEQLAKDLEKRKRKAEKEEAQDYTPNKKKKKKKKPKDCTQLEEIEEDKDVRLEKETKEKRKRSLELEKMHEKEEFEHQRKKKEKKSVKKVKRTKNDEDYNEESLKKKSKKKKKEEKLQSEQSTENQKLPSVVSNKENKLKSKERKGKNTKAQDSSFDEDVNPIHFEWNPSEEVKQKFKIRQGRWTKKEEKILKENMEQYLLEYNLEEPSNLIFAHLHGSESEEGRKWKEFARTTNFYRKLAKGLNRSIFFVYRKVLRSFDQGNYLGTFSESEDRELEKLVTIHGKKWEKIGRLMGRSGLAVIHRYKWISGNRGNWKDDEVDLLKEAVRKVTNTNKGEEVFTNINWNAVASIVKTRNADQCRKKWLSKVCWKDCMSAPWKKWGVEEDLQLIKKVYESSVTEESDIDWYKLQKDFEIARSPEWLHMKFKVILKKYCRSIDFENTDFEDVIDYLYNVKRKDIEDRHCDHQDSSLE